MVFITFGFKLKVMCMDKTEMAKALRTFYYHGREVNHGDKFLMNKSDYDKHLKYGFIEPIVLKEIKTEITTTKEEKATTRKTKAKNNGGSD